MITERNTDPTSEITPENIVEYEYLIGNLREQKGKERETLPLIRKVRDVAKANKIHQTVVRMWLEEALIGQHLGMAQMRSSSGKRDVLELAEGTLMMINGTLNAWQYSEKHAVDDEKPSVYRHLGRIADEILKQPKAAMACYEKAMEQLETQVDHYSKARIAELSGFYAADLIKLDKVEEGVEIAKSGFSVLYSQESEVTRWMQENYPKTLVIWQTGIAFRTINSVLDVSPEYKREEMIGWFQESVTIIKNSSTNESDFSFRKDAANAIANRLGLPTPFNIKIFN